jgi:sugar lactone lactonase YvrE
LGALALLTAFLLVPHAARAAWTNGQAATVVLGQSDFVSSTDATTQNGLQGPTSVCWDKSSGKVFVMEMGNNRVLRFSSAAALSNGANAEAVFGQSSYTSRTSALTQSGFDEPFGCAITDSGDLWIADGFNRRVLLYADAANKPEFGATADKVLGQADFTHASSTENRSTLGGFVYSVAVSPDGSALWAADGTRYRILRWDNPKNKANGADADSVLGQSDFTTSDYGLSATKLTIIYGIALDAEGNLYVSDYNNGRVLRFDNAASLGVGAAASGVLGAADFDTAGTGDVSASTFTPWALGVGSDGRLYVGDATHYRILIFNSPASKANGADADFVLGQTDFTSSSSGSTTSSTVSGMALRIDSDPLNGILYAPDGMSNRVLGFYNEELIPRTLTVSPSAGGSVSADSGAVASCTSAGGTCSGSYGTGTTIVLTATPDTGKTTQWGSGCSSTSGNTCTVSGISANTTVNVAFAVAAGVPLGGTAAYAGFGLALLCLAAVVLRTRDRRSR